MPGSSSSRILMIQLKWRNPPRAREDRQLNPKKKRWWWWWWWWEVYLAQGQRHTPVRERTARVYLVHMLGPQQFRPHLGVKRHPHRNSARRPKPNGSRCRAEKHKRGRKPAIRVWFRVYVGLGPTWTPRTPSRNQRLSTPCGKTRAAPSTCD